VVKYLCLCFSLKGLSRIQIAVDGPAGAGKSTIAKILAEKLGFLYIDSGAMYRAITYLALENGVSCEDEEALSKIALETEIDFVITKTGEQLVICNGQDVTALIRDPQINEKVSLVSQHPGVRQALVKKQQALAKRRDVVMDGRDIGTVVLPKADCKIFLTASLAERARRRHLELREKGYLQEYDTIKTELERRDKLDEGREVGPLSIASDAVVIDTTGISLGDVVLTIMRIYEQKMG